MDASELDDFRAILSDYGYSEMDFTLNEVDKTKWSPNTIVPLQGSITVKRVSTHKERKYNSDSGSCWVADFETDLKQGSYS